MVFSKAVVTGQLRRCRQPNKSTVTSQVRNFVHVNGRLVAILPDCSLSPRQCRFAVEMHFALIKVDSTVGSTTISEEQENNQRVVSDLSDVVISQTHWLVSQERLSPRAGTSVFIGTQC